ncbi:MAG: DNA-processing protein DprA [Anaerolineae bacterium]
MTSPPEVAYWLALIHHSRLKLNQLKPVIHHICLQQNQSLAVLFGMPSSEIEARFGLNVEEAQSILAAQAQLPKAAQQLERWQAGDIRLITRADPGYPLRLAYAMPLEQQPLLLWIVGPVTLLNEPAVAILGSTDPTESTQADLRELAAALAAEKINLVNGYGRGLERAAVEAMLETEAGRVLIFIPMGLAAFAGMARPLFKEAAAGRAALVSPFSPSTPFKPGLAAARNVLVDHLAYTLLVPQADTETKGRAIAALNRGASVFVGLQDSPDHRALIDAGALLMTDSGEIIEFVEQAIIDATLQAEAGPPPGLEPISPASPAISAPTDDDFSLSLPETEPLEAGEALKILSSGGQVPEVLKRRLEQQHQLKDE